MTARLEQNKKTNTPTSGRSMWQLLKVAWWIPFIYINDLTKIPGNNVAAIADDTALLDNDNEIL